jgi:hypothetical protein
MRFSRIALTLAAASMTALPALTQTDFTYKEYAPQGAASITAPNAHSADFNGDGLADVLSPQVVYNCVNGTCTAQYFIYLYLNSSSGLQSPQKLAVTLTDQPAGIAISDFNGDNKLDIAVLSPSGVISVLYGNGNGTFAAPVNVTLPAGNYSSLVEADFDVNGTQDLAALNQNGSLALLFNDGKGNFTQQPVQVDTPASGYTANSLVVGDFNADGRPDIAWVEEGNITSQDNTVYSALNTAKGVFSTRHEVGTELPGFSGLLSADLDLDGKSDLITWSTQLSENCCQDEPVMTYFSNGDGTFAGSQLASTITYGLGVTDINGDGNPDVLISSEAGFTIYTGSGNRTFSDGGTNTMLQGGTDQVGLGFYQNTNQMGFASQNGGPTDPNYDAYIYTLFNDNPQGDCAYPASAGVTFCKATQTGSTVQVRGTARAQTEPVREIQLWANGKMLYQVWSDEFNATLTLPAGTTITAVEVESNGTTKSATTSTSTSSTCAAPSSAGVHVCSPTEGEVTPSPVTITAAGTGASGTVNHLELWIDGTKIGNYSGSTMNTSVTLADGSHAITVVEVDSKGNDVKSSPVDITVGTASACAAPSSPGVNVCSPTQGEIAPSPVTVTASGTGASGAVNHLELWIDGTKIGNYSGSTMNTSVTLADGSHAITVVEVDSKGNDVKSSPVNITVGTASACAAPSSPGVDVCSPTAGESTASPVSFVATGKGASGSVNHLELWIDGTKVGNYSGATMSTSVSEPAGSHTATVIEVDSAGNYVKSTPVTYTVK